MLQRSGDQGQGSTELMAHGSEKLQFRIRGFLQFPGQMVQFLVPAFQFHREPAHPVVDEESTDEEIDSESDEEYTEEEE